MNLEYAYNLSNAMMSKLKFLKRSLIVKFILTQACRRLQTGSRKLVLKYILRLENVSETFI
jgi:hypothetical protein